MQQKWSSAAGSGGSSVGSGAWSVERSGGAFDAAAADAFPDLNRPQKPLLMSSMVAEWLGRVSRWLSRPDVGGAPACRVFGWSAGSAGGVGGAGGRPGVCAKRLCFRHRRRTDTAAGVRRRYPA